MMSMRPSGSPRSTRSNVVDFAARAKAKRVDPRAFTYDLPFDATYQMPERLKHDGSPRLTEAQADATDVVKRSIRNLGRFAAQPENISMFARALDGRSALDRPQGVNDRVMKIAQLLQPSHADVAVPPQAQVVHSLPAKLLAHSDVSNALPLPIAMAFVERADGPDRILFARDLGFRDMQLQAEHAAPIYVLKLARSVGLKPVAAAALPRLAVLLRSPTDHDQVSAPAFPRKPVKILMDNEIQQVCPENCTFDQRLTH